jgi:hypothetical protein
MGEAWGPSKKVMLLWKSGAVGRK